MAAIRHSANWWRILISLDKLLHRILDTGAQVKDINTGLLDFPALRNGHEVYLCWKYGEDQIAFWHEVDAGFAGRQPIEVCFDLSILSL